ncbi:DUF4062 domain-containing protein [Hymenobacter sp. 15J16-1T3B]|uniref:DUF4062 domain-containing protein n=1 Tax=Hymenobacter sp. 15J16-1T3B TaxID=2886941 RepID=UPI001D118DDD|nr:DUF4062 domain-containing protein [Hymenobacter sp. 15J16-1T3B]
MAKSLTHISIFLASPSDLQQERKAVAETVIELNGVLRTTMNVCLDLLTWETHSFPSVGEDAQDVINKQIGEDYDIFLGLMWSRFGSVTGRAGSGTEEEFNRAYDNHLKSSGKTKVMMYFGSKPIVFEDIDVDQIVKIKEFKKKTQDMGVLHSSFTDVDDLVRLLKLHLPHHIKEIIDDDKPISINSMDELDGGKVEKVFDNPIELDVDMGYWDYQEVFQSNFSEIGIVMEALTEYLHELTSNMNDTTDKLNSLKERGNYKPTEVKLVISKFSKEIFHYVNKSKVEVSRFNELYTEGIDSLTKGFYIADADYEMGIDEVRQLVSDLDETAAVVKSAAKSARGFKSKINNWPSVSKELNIAIRTLNNNIDMTIKEFLGCEKMLSELSDLVNDKLAKLEGEADPDTGTGASLADE